MTSPTNPLADLSADPLADPPADPPTSSPRLRIVMLMSQGADVRALRAARFLSAKHDVMLAVPALPEHHPSAIVDIAPREGIRTVGLRRWENVASVLDDHLAPDIVWCHGLTAVWSYGSSGTYTNAIADQIHSGVPISDTSWWPQRGRAKIVYDIHEYEPDRPLRYNRALDKANWIERERRSITLADALVAVSPEIADLTLARRLSPHPVEVVTNAPPRLGRPLRTEEARDFLDEGVKLDRGRKILVFAGNPTPDRAMSELAYALDRLEADRPHVLFLCGPHHEWKNCGVRADALVAAPYGWDAATTPDLTLLDYLSACDVAWSGAWIDFENWRSGAPNKMYEYAAAGVAQVAPVGMQRFDRLNRDNRWGLGYSKSAVGAAHAIATILRTGMRADPTLAEETCYETNALAFDRVIARAMGARAPIIREPTVLDPSSAGQST